MTKITNKYALNYVLDSCTIPDEIRAKLEGMIAQLDKRSAADRKPTARQTENEELKQIIMNIVGSEPMTVTDIMKADPIFDGMSNQRVAAQVKQLKDAGFLDKETIKGRSYFTKA